MSSMTFFSKVEHSHPECLLQYSGWGSKRIIWFACASSATRATHPNIERQWVLTAEQTEDCLLRVLSYSHNLSSNAHCFAKLPQNLSPFLTISFLTVFGF